jgi:hypothetical protein
VLVIFINLVGKISTMLLRYETVHICVLIYHFGRILTMLFKSNCTLICCQPIRIVLAGGALSTVEVCYEYGKTCFLITICMHTSIQHKNGKVARVKTMVICVQAHFYHFWELPRKLQECQTTCPGSFLDKNPQIGSQQCFGSQECI